MVTKSLRSLVRTPSWVPPRINGQRPQIKFQTDYMTPAYKSANKTPRQTVTTLGQILLELDTTTKQPMFCSEFAWPMIALSGCTPEEIRDAPPESAACVDPAFAPSPMVAGDATKLGLAEGPLVAAMQLPEAGRAGAIASVFAEGDAARLSSGHRMVAEQIAPLMGPLAQFFQARVASATVEETASVAGQLDANFPDNYSPTGFLVAAMGAAASRPVDYLATVLFLNDAQSQQARRLASTPVCAVP